MTDQTTTTTTTGSAPSPAPAPRERTDVELLAVRSDVAPYLQDLIDIACDSGLLTPAHARLVACARRIANGALDQLEAPLLGLLEAHRQVALSPYGEQHTLTLTLYGPLALAALRRWAADRDLPVVREVLRHPSGDEIVECPCYSVQHCPGVFVDVHHRGEERVPSYVARRGHSIDAAARSLGLRALLRRELVPRFDVVAEIREIGGGWAGARALSVREGHCG